MLVVVVLVVVVLVESNAADVVDTDGAVVDVVMMGIVVVGFGSVVLDVGAALSRQVLRAARTLSMVSLVFAGSSIGSADGPETMMASISSSDSESKMASAAH